MSEEYTWNNPNSIAAQSIRQFLDRASFRIEQDKALPFKAAHGQPVINWMRALLSMPPSQLEEYKE